jgi:predicted DNA binding CopG/RHH family protein
MKHTYSMEYDKYFQDTSKRKEKFNILFDKTDLAYIRAEAAKHDITVTTFIRGLINAYKETNANTATN